MAGKKTSGGATAPSVAKEPTAAELQRRMEEAREDISQTVEEIKDTVTERYETVKETVTETLDWRQQFRKHSVAWSLGALALGYVVGSSLANSIQGSTKKKGRKSGGFFDEVYAMGEKLSDEFSGVARTILLPALSKKIKDSLGIDLSERLLASRPTKAAARPRKRPVKKAAAKKPGKSGAAKKGAGKKGAKKRGSK
jgi:hypothetical protein